MNTLCQRCLSAPNRDSILPLGHLADITMHRNDYSANRKERRYTVVANRLGFGHEVDTWVRFIGSSLVVSPYRKTLVQATNTP